LLKTEERQGISDINHRLSACEFLP